MTHRPQLPCPTCDRLGTLQLDGDVEVAVGSVAVHLDQRVTVVCPEGHDRAPERLVAAAMAATESGVPRARARLLRQDACAACRAALTMPARRSTRVVTVDDTELPTVTLTFDLPMARCPDCGLDQLPSRSQEDLVVAVPAVFTGMRR